MRKALILDRDGVVNVEKQYVHRIEDFVFLPNVLTTCVYFQQRGYTIVIVSNQSGIGRGYYSEEQFWTLTKWMLTQFEESGVNSVNVYYCPHHPTEAKGRYRVACECRKPKPGMILNAKEDLCLDLAGSVLVGDKRTDIEAAMAAGVGTTVLSRSGHKISKEDEKFAGLVIEDLCELRHVMHVQ